MNEINFEIENNNNNNAINKKKLQKANLIVS
jgi:hypothetical protein